MPGVHLKTFSRLARSETIVVRGVDQLVALVDRLPEELAKTLPDVVHVLL